MTDQWNYHAFHHEDDPLPPEVRIQNGPISIYADPETSHMLLHNISFIIWLATQCGGDDKDLLRSIAKSCDQIAPFFEAALVDLDEEEDAD